MYFSAKSWFFSKYTEFLHGYKMKIGDLRFVWYVRLGCFTNEIRLISLTHELQPAAGLVHIDARDTNQLLVTSHVNRSRTFRALLPLHAWKTNQPSSLAVLGDITKWLHSLQASFVSNQIWLRFFLANLKSSGWVDFAVGGKLAFSTTPKYLLEDFLAPFKGHLKLSKINQNFSIYLRTETSLYEFSQWMNPHCSIPISRTRRPFYKTLR